MRPGPCSASAIAPTPGPTTATPSPVSVATLRCVAGCCHIRTFIAGRDEDRQRGGEQHGRGEVVRVPARHLGEEVRRGGRHDDEVGVAGEADMADLGLVLAVEEIGVRPLARQRGGGERRDEGLRAGGEDRAARTRRARAGGGSGRATCRPRCRRR